MSLFSDDKKWFYVSGEEVKGPFEENEMVYFFTQKVIDNETHVWYGDGNYWTPLKYTTIATHVSEEYGNAEELEAAANIEKHPENINNKMYIPYCIVGALGFMLLCWDPSETDKVNELVAGIVLAVWGAINTFIGTMDSKKLKENGYIPPKKSAAALPPIYMYKKAKILCKTAKGSIALWLTSTIIGGIILASIFLPAAE